MANDPVKLNRARLAAEEGTTLHSWSEGRYRVALIYPNTYSQGMANLGFQTVYRLINQRGDCLCERFFYPDKEDLEACNDGRFPLLSIESQRPLREFDLIAFSISFENDYLNLPLIFAAANFPLFAEERNDEDPLVLMGGVCAFINPEPLAEIADIIAVGEAEAMLGQMLNKLCSAASGRDELLHELAGVPGVYIPRFYQPRYADNGDYLGVMVEPGIPERVRRQYAPSLAVAPSRSFIQTPESEFGDMSLIEVSRGCSRGCRFCAAGYVYLPPREHGLDDLLAQVDAGLAVRDRVGLVAAAVADHSELAALQQGILDRDGKMSLSSLRLDALTADEVEKLKAADHKTVAIAPEAGSQRLRDFINKGISEEQILHAVNLLADGGIKNLKLYFIVGLPSEEQEDVEAIIDLARKIGDIWRAAGRSSGVMGQLTLSINPFVPKPFTPLQWAGMEAEKSLQKKYRYLHSAVSRLPNTRMISESLRQARLQALLSRGDRRLGRVLPLLAAGRNPRQACRDQGLDMELFVTGSFAGEAPFPWEIIDQGFGRDYLWSEYQRALAAKTTPPCFPGCRRCGVCVEPE
ncbi:MAG: radical SAM protein [Desulfuromonas sp.]|nr:MAG: radical SAM protein [Desulfuromonas sp.]